MPNDLTDDGTEEDWEQKYKTLQGMHQADQQRLTAEIQVRDQRIAGVEQTLANLQGQSQALTQMVQQKETPPPEPRLTADIVDGAGQEVTQYVEAVLHDHINPYLNEIQNLRQQVGQVHGAFQQSQAQLDALRQETGRANETQYYSHLKASVPNYDHVNMDPKFKEWLMQPDDFTGRSRSEILTHAHKAQDATMVANMFNSYVRSSGGSNGVGAVQMNNPYHSQIAPPRGFGTPRNNGAGAPGKQWTREEISKFYADKASGNLGTDTEKIAAIERDIFSASAEGRINTQ